LLLVAIDNKPVVKSTSANILMEGEIASFKQKS
jgi:hypothetical protein